MRAEQSCNSKDVAASNIGMDQSQAKGIGSKKLTHMKTLKRALNKAKALGYIGFHCIKNKDTSAWTQPADPLLIKIEQLQQKSNIYGEEHFTQEYESIEAAFLSTNDRRYIRSYAEDQFEDMVRQEMREGNIDRENLDN